MRWPPRFRWWASALQALTEHLRVTAGQRVLIHGGAGGIGSVAIQLAKHLGAHVATTVRADDFDAVKLLGADTVIDYRTQKFEEAVSNVDAVLDTVGGDTYTRSFKVLRKGGRLVSMIEQPNQKLMNEHGVEGSFPVHAGHCGATGEVGEAGRPRGAQGSCRGDFWAE
jgi:alcohol dehydrogenase